MILSSSKILEQFEAGNWKINKAVKDIKHGPNSIDVTLSKYILEPTEQGDVLDLEVDREDLYKEKEVKHSLNFWRGAFMLGSTQEVIDCSKPVKVDGEFKYFIPMYEGRSTLARLGLLSHLSAGFGDYGFKGSFTLELKNVGSWILKLKPGMRIGQVYFEEVDEDVMGSYYEGYDQTDGKPQAPRLGKGRF